MSTCICDKCRRVQTREIMEAEKLKNELHDLLALVRNRDTIEIGPGIRYLVHRARMMAGAEYDRLVREAEGNGLSSSTPTEGNGEVAR